MADKSSGNGSEPKRKPFKRGEREQTLELLAKHILQLDDIDEKKKRVKEKIEALKEDLRSGGFLDDAQTSIPGTEERDELGSDARA